MVSVTFGKKQSVIFNNFARQIWDFTDSGAQSSLMEGVGTLPAELLIFKNVGWVFLSRSESTTTRHEDNSIYTNDVVPTE